MDLGVVQAKGNDSMQYNLGTDIAYRRPRSAVNTSYYSNIATSVGASAATRNQVNLLGYHLMDDGNWFYAAVGGIRQSSVQNISLRGNVGGGIGTYLKNSNRIRLAVIGGLGWQTTEYSIPIFPEDSQSLATAALSVQLHTFRFKKTRLEVSAWLYPALTPPNQGRLFFDLNASYYLKLAKDLHWTLSFYGNWDSRPPNTFPGSDYGSAAGLNWKFGGR